MEELGEHATSYMSDKVFSCYIKRKNIDIILFTELFTCGSSAQVHSESGDLHSSYDSEHLRVFCCCMDMPTQVYTECILHVLTP